MRRSLLPITSLVLVALATGASAQLEQIFVPQDFETIQAALEAAPQNTEVVIASGTYAESVSVTGKSSINVTCKGKVVIAPPSGDGLTLEGCSTMFIQN